MKTDHDYTLPRWFWLWLPPALYLAHYAAHILLEKSVYEAWWTSETGLTEQLTVLILAAAMVMGLVITIRLARARQWQLALWFGLFTLGCLYFGGEEISWGQQWFGWATPESWQALNNQGETNLHNSNSVAGSLLDQLPRNLLAIGILIGGGILPLVRRMRDKPLAPDTRKYWLMPGMACVPVGFIAPLASLPEKLFDSVPFVLHIQFGEVKELMIALFLLIYIVATLSALRTYQLPPLHSGTP